MPEKPFEEPIRDRLKAFERELRGSLSSEAPLIAEVALHIMRSRGKRVRPAVVFLSARACGYEGESDVPAALAIELIHTATLLHDDVIDESDTRRGETTVNAKWNNLVSVLMGDYLFAKSFSVMLRPESFPLLRTISAATEEVSVGELLQEQESGNLRLSERKYIEIVRRKTAALFSAAAASGGILAGLSKAGVNALGRAGQSAGIAFQIVDDMLDYTGRQGRTGKPSGNDLQQGKVTLPLIAALRGASRSERAAVRRVVGSGEDCEPDAIVDLIKRRNGFEYARDKARGFGEKAIAGFEALPPSKARKALTDLVTMFIERDR
jgi:octaprenyl-diphosphate synthase